MDITKQQLAKLSKRMEALAQEHTEVAEKVMAKQTELAELEVELEEARRLTMQPMPPPTPPPSQALRGPSSPRVMLLPLASLVRRRLLCSKFLLLKTLESIMESFQQRHSLLEQELIATEQRELEDALGWSG